MIIYAGILEYPVSSPLVSDNWFMHSVHTIDATIDASIVNKYSSIKLQIC